MVRGEASANYSGCIGDDCKEGLKFFDLMDEQNQYKDQYLILNNNNAKFTVKLYEKIALFAYNVNFNFALLQTIGRVLGCMGWKYFTGFDTSLIPFKITLPFGLNCWIYGLMFWAIGFALSLSFVFYMFDAVIELGIFGAALPFGIACWPFKMFTKSATTAAKLFMNSMFTFMMAGVAVKVCMLLLSNAIGAGTAIDDEGAKGIAGLVHALDTLDTDRLKKLLAVINVGFLIFVFAGISGFLLISKIQMLTNMFAGGGLKGSAPGIATMAASAAKGTAKKVAAPTTKAIGDKLNKGAKNVLTKAKNSKVGKAVGKAGKFAAGAALAIATGPVGWAAGGLAVAGKVGQMIQNKKAKGKGDDKKQGAEDKKGDNKGDFNKQQDKGGDQNKGGEEKQGAQSSAGGNEQPKPNTDNQGTQV